MASTIIEGDKMKKQIQVIAVMLALAFSIGACLPAAAEPQAEQAQQVQNTPALDSQSQINTAVAQTIEAQNQIGTAVALTTEAQYTATPTATPFTIPTLTPFVVLTPTTKPSSGGGSTYTKPEYACDVIRIRPTAYSEYNRGQEFDIKMTVVNQGTRSWYAGYDLKYAGGPKMTSVLQVELPAMKPGDMHEVIFDANAPAEKGNQTMTWTVEGRLCFGYVTITVK
jgi:hypothetical protein